MKASAPAGESWALRGGGLRAWARQRTAVEQLVEVVLNGPAAASHARSGLRELAEKALEYDARRTRVVVLGGGTGLSTVVGGNSQMPEWADYPFVGLKQEFPHLDVVVCTTDDGGSTGLLVKQLPMIGIGDLRKSCVSLILPANLQRLYRIGEKQTRDVIRLIARVFNHRFRGEARDARILRNPLLMVPPRLQKACPTPLAEYLRSLGSHLAPGGRGPRVDPSGHCLGNLLLTAAVFRASGATRRAPSVGEIRAGIDDVARMIGMRPGCLHAATATPGQLKVRYANGVEVYGQRKAALARRGFPVEWLVAEFADAPAVSQAVCRAIREADLIVFAPGSLYSSMIPILQIHPITRAIRANRKALKVLGANFWVQEGETDISPGDETKGFLVSDVIEAYDRNVPGGAGGLFDIVLCANLEHIPGDILRNYALEGKRPIHLDRARVEAMGYQPVEATLFSLDELKLSRVIHHDPGKVALAVRALLYARKTWRGRKAGALRRQTMERPSAWGRHREPAPVGGRHRTPLLCDYMASVEKILGAKDCRPRLLRDTIRELAWENRDIHPSHLAFFDGARVIPARHWNRSTDWDNVLGYYDSEDRQLKVHEQLISKPARLKEDLLIALGESLLGRYIESRHWIEGTLMGTGGARCYEIRLRPAGERQCYLNDAQLRRYLELARMVVDGRDPRLYRITINNNEGFLPSGLLFGLLYAWYLNNAYGGIMEYEMSLLRWPPGTLIPHQAKERVRKQALVEFFRTEIFGRRHG